MKLNRFNTLAAITLAVVFSVASTRARPDDNANSVSMVQLPSVVSEVIKLHQANISDDTILAYISNSAPGYALNADQIIYLQQQGLSSPIITAILNQGHGGTVMVSAPAPASTPAPAPVAPPASSAPAAVTSSAPAPVPTSTVTYVQPAPVTYYYPAAPTYYYAPAYYPAYYYPPVTIGIGWGWGWRGGYGWHGGWRR